MPKAIATSGPAEGWGALTPDIDAFIGLAGDPLHQTEARPLREEALERTLWMVSQPAPGTS